MSDIERTIVQAKEEGHPVATFTEPDLDNQLTAIATTYGTGIVRKFR